MNKFENLVVQKYGGATLATPEMVKAAALRIQAQASKGPLIAVVSAMGSTTNSLIELAQKVSRHPHRRELDMLLSVGERISMSLVSMALQDAGVPAISFTGSQAGVFTDEDHFNARIVDVRAARVEESLRAGRVVVLAGFQGVSPVTKEITTLGRGGSDLTAVAMAAAFGARRCEILKDVSAVFTADPRMITSARPLQSLGYDELLEMTYWGSKVLHYRSVELARSQNVPLYVGPAAAGVPGGTLIDKGSQMENNRPLSVNSHECVLEIDLGRGEMPDCLRSFEQALLKKEIASPQILSWKGSADSHSLLVTGTSEILSAIKQEFTGAGPVRIVRGDLCSVTLTCAGSLSPSLWEKIFSKMKEHRLQPREIRSSALSATVFLDQKERAAAMAALHELI